MRLSRPNPRVGRLSASATMWPDKWFSSTESGLQAAFVRSICKVGELESWEVGKLESWEVGKLESWRVGKWGSWRVGELESGEVGKLESWEVEKLEMQGWVSNPPVHGFAPIAPRQMFFLQTFNFRLSFARNWYLLHSTGGTSSLILFFQGVEPLAEDAVHRRDDHEGIGIGPCHQFL